MGTEREGHGILVDEEGLVLTIGYLIMEADTVTITDIEGNELAARIVGYIRQAAIGDALRSLRNGLGVR